MVVEELWEEYRGIALAKRQWEDLHGRALLLTVTTLAASRPSQTEIASDNPCELNRSMQHHLVN
jgi:hypothetical protein